VLERECAVPRIRPAVVVIAVAVAIPALTAATARPDVAIQAAATQLACPAGMTWQGGTCR
jgi:hypothetical protein